MNEAMLDEIAVEKACKERFGVALTIGDVIIKAVPVGIAARATVFMTSNRQVYVYIVAQSGLVLDDVRKIVSRMQCEAQTFIPPYGEAEYFERIGRNKFKAMFPGKAVHGEDDLRYYKNLAAYNPALVLLSKIKGELRGYDAEAHMWRKVKDYTYSKIRPTS